MLEQDTLDYYRSWLEYRGWFQRVPGVQVCVREDGQLRLSAAFGNTDEPAAEPLTEQHLFRIASHSKTFTAVALLRLAAQGRLQLDDPVASHLPELRPTRMADTSVRELLSHGGGVIRDSEDGDFWQGMKAYPDRAQLLAIASEPSAAVLPRAERFKYSNISYGLLGLVIEQVTGADFAGAISQLVTEPLNLIDLGAEPDAAQRSRLAAGHSALSTARERTTIEHVDTRALAAATGFYATAGELTAFYTALLPGNNVLLSDDWQRRLRQRQWEVKEQVAYGLGVFLNKIGEYELFGHSGGYPGHITRTFACPTRRIVASVLTNAIDGPAEPMAEALFRLLDTAAAASHASAENGSRFTGRFASLWGLHDVACLNGRLFALNPTAAFPTDDPIALEIIDETTLKMVSGPGGSSIGEYMRYDFAPDGSIRSVRGNSGMTSKPFRQPV